MLHDRRSRIVNKITEEHMVKVTELMQEFGVSIETIRRDLEYLEKRGYLRRVYGGAVLDGLYGQEPSYEHREVIKYPEKQAIAAKTCELIDDGDSVFIDVGTTTLEVAHYLSTRKNLTVITNATLVAHSLITNESCRVILLGGELRRGELSVSGSLCNANIQLFNANKAIIGVGGITIEKGISDYHVEEANIRRSMISRASKVIAVADHSKFGVNALNSICKLSSIDTLITDWNTPAKTISAYTAAGVNILVAHRLS